MSHLRPTQQCHFGYVQGSEEAILDLDDLAAGNARLLGEVADRDLTTLVPAILDSTRAVTDAARNMPADSPVCWHGVEVPLSGLMGMLLGELLFHGRDLAEALNKRLPISRDTGVLMVTAILDVVPFLVDPDSAAGVDVVYEVRFRGGPTVFLCFRDGELTVEREFVGAVDCRISADPVAFLLVNYRRRSQWNEILRGHLLAWGRKPWEAFRLVSLIRAP